MMRRVAGPFILTAAAILAAPRAESQSQASARGPAQATAVFAGGCFWGSKGCSGT
jgi:hypothetical protein